MIHSRMLEIMLRSLTIMDTHTLKGMIDMTVTTTNINQMLFAQTIGNMGTLAPFVLLETNFYACPNLM